MKRFQSNVHPHDYKHPELKGDSQTVPNQVASITDIVYRFQGGIIPNTVNVSYDPIDAPEGYINVQNISGFDLTDAFHHLQNGREKYQAYIAEKGCCSSNN